MKEIRILDEAASASTKAEYAKLQRQFLYPDFDWEKSFIVTNGIIYCDNEHNSIIPIIATDDEGEILGSSEISGSNFTGRPLLLPANQHGPLAMKIQTDSEGQLQIGDERTHLINATFDETVSAAFPDLTDKPVHVLLSGAYVNPEARGHKLYRRMFEERIRFLHEGFRKNELSVIGNDGVEVDPREVILLISNRGPWRHNEKIPSLKENVLEQTTAGNNIVLFDAFEERGIPASAIGLPNSESTNVSRLILRDFNAEKTRSELDFRLLGISWQHGGPYYAARLPAQDSKKVRT